MRSGRHAEALGDLLIAIFRRIAVIPEYVAGPISCARSLSRDTTVTRRPSARQSARQRADQIVGLVLRTGELGHPQVPAVLAAQRELPLAAPPASARDWPCRPDRACGESSCPGSHRTPPRHSRGCWRSSRSPRKRAKPYSAWVGLPSRSVRCRAASSARRGKYRPRRRSGRPLRRASRLSSASARCGHAADCCAGNAPADIPSGPPARAGP